MTRPTLAPAAPRLVSMASMAEANPSFSVIASSVIAIGCDSDDDAIVVEGCQRVVVSMPRKIETLGKCAARETQARTRKFLALRGLQRNVGVGSSGWTRTSKPSDYQVNEQDFHADLPGRPSWTQRRQGNAKMLQKSTKQTRRSRCSERFAKGMILNVMVRPARLERATSWFVARQGRHITDAPIP